MAVYRIVLEGDSVLREKAMEVTRLGPNLFKLLDNMRDTMYANSGVGLAAPQIGVSKRVIVVDAGDGLYEVINPVISDMEGEESAVEGCLSIPDLAGEVARAAAVVVRGKDRLGGDLEIRAEGLAARVFQHETDHLDGILFIDKAVNIKRTAD